VDAMHDRVVKGEIGDNNRIEPHLLMYALAKLSKSFEPTVFSR
jgi:hypothetical protein